MNIIVVAGANGSGKSTYIKNIINSGLFNDYKYICPDEEVKNVDPQISDIMDRYILAMTKCDELRLECIKNKRPFIMETVLSTVDKINELKYAKELGYEITIFYIATKSPVINIKRVGERVSFGGHDVPKEKIMSRYERSMSNIHWLFDVADSLIVYDNSDDADIGLPKIVMEYSSDDSIYIINSEYRNTRWVNKYIKRYLEQIKYDILN